MMLDIDDVVLYSDTWTSHLAQINELFKRLSAANLTVNHAEWEFGQASVSYLAKVVRSGHVRPVWAKIQRPAMNFKGFLVSHPNILSPKVPFGWSVKCLEIFDNAKSLLVSALALATPNFDCPFCVAVDTRDGCCSVAVSRCSVSYYSRFNHHQQAYTVKREALALILTRHFEVYLGSSLSPVDAYSDHNPLVFIDWMKNQN